MKELEKELLKLQQKKEEDIKFSMCEWLQHLVGHDLLVFFGNPGVGKTKICSQIAIECAKEGKQIVYYDTELNISKKGIEALRQFKNIQYIANPDYETMVKIKPERQFKTADYVIIDSTTLYITGLWAFADMHRRGKLLQMLQHMYYNLKMWAQQNKKTVILVAQPISEMGDRHEIGPVGDKAAFITKTILKVVAERGNDEIMRNRRIIVFKSRDIPDGTMLTKFETTNTGVKFLNRKRMMEIVRGE